MSSFLLQKPIILLKIKYILFFFNDDNLDWHFAVNNLFGLYEISPKKLEVFAPIAYRLGFNELFRQLEDLCFSNLFPY